MKLFLTFSTVMAVALGVAQNFGGSQPTNFQQSQNFKSDQFQTEQFQSQGFQQQQQQQQFKLQQSSNPGQSNQYLPPRQNNPGFNNPGLNNANNRRPGQGYRQNPQGSGQGFPQTSQGQDQGFSQNQAQSINVQGSEFQGNQAQQAYGNKLESHQNQHQNQQGNIRNPTGSGYPKNPNRNQNYQNQNKQNQNSYHSESHSAHSAASASSSSKYEHQQGFKGESSLRKPNSQYNIDDDIIKSEASPDGGYSYSYDISDGTSVEQTGYIKNPGARSEDKILSVKGSYSYIAPEGDRISVSYVADENGYRATSIKS